MALADIREGLFFSSTRICDRVENRFQSLFSASCRAASKRVSFVCGGEILNRLLVHIWITR